MSVWANIIFSWKNYCVRKWAGKTMGSNEHTCGNKGAPLLIKQRNRSGLLWLTVLFVLILLWDFRRITLGLRVSLRQICSLKAEVFLRFGRAGPSKADLVSSALGLDALLCALGERLICLWLFISLISGFRPLNDFWLLLLTAKHQHSHFSTSLSWMNTFESKSLAIPHETKKE